MRPSLEKMRSFRDVVKPQENATLLLWNNTNRQIIDIFRLKTDFYYTKMCFLEVLLDRYKRLLPKSTKSSSPHFPKEVSFNHALIHEGSVCVIAREVENNPVEAAKQTQRHTHYCGDLFHLMKTFIFLTPCCVFDQYFQGDLNANRRDCCCTWNYIRSPSWSMQRRIHRCLKHFLIVICTVSMAIFTICSKTSAI